MKAFVLRELRRQAPVALAVFVLGMLILFASLFYRLDRYGLESAAAVSVVAVLIVAPLLLGVASVSPDAESGAIAFLAHLPRSPLRELLLRWSVVAVLTGVATLADYAVARAYSGNVPIDVFGYDRVPVGVLSLLAFATGVASSVAFRQTITAIVFAPAFAIPLLALRAMGDELAGWRTSDAGSILLVCGAGFVLAGAALGFLRGDLHRASWRPLKLVVGVILAGSLLAAGSALAIDQVPGSWHWGALPALRDGSNEHVVFFNQRSVGLGRRWESRLYVTSPRGGTPLVVDGAAQALSFAPDGKKLLVRNDVGMVEGLSVVDVATGRLEKRSLGDGSLERFWNHEGESWLTVAGPGACLYVPVAWRNGEPVFVTKGTLESWRGEARTFAGRVESLGGTRALVALESGERFVQDLETDGRVVSGLASLPRDVKIVAAKLSPRGDWVAACGERGQTEASLFLASVGDQRLLEVPVGRLEVTTGLWLEVEFTVERILVHSNLEARRCQWVVDPRTGSREELAWKSAWSSIRVSPRGTRALVREDSAPDHHVIDFATGARVGADVSSRSGFLDEERLLLNEDDSAVRVRDIATGRESVLLR